MPAFYQTKVFKEDSHSIRYYAKVRSVQEVYRWELFPDLPRNHKSQKRYYKLELEPLQRLSQPIFSRRLRRVTFIPTTWEKFLKAVEINDLWNTSPLEDKLWAEFKRLEIDAQRQEEVRIDRQTYFLDFAIYCTYGKIDVETDGDTWHSQKDQIAQDNKRDNDLETEGWRTLRFNTHSVQEEMAEYCIPKIVENINRLGGIQAGGKSLPRKIQLQEPKDGTQLELL